MSSRGMFYHSTQTCMCTRCLNMKRYLYEFTFGSGGVYDTIVTEDGREYVPLKDGHPFYKDFEKCVDDAPHSIVVLDDKIAETVRILNMKGYKTEFSCEGHREIFTYNINNEFADGVQYSIPYISFKAGYVLPAIAECSLPHGWRVEYSYLNNMKSYSIYYDDHTENIYFDEQKLVDWANSLDDMSKVQKDLCDKFIDEIIKEE